MKVCDVGKYYQDFFEDFNPEKFDDMCEKMGLEPSMKVRELSSGMNAKLKIAATLARNARLFLLEDVYKRQSWARSSVCRTASRSAESVR